MRRPTLAHVLLPALLPALVAATLLLLAPARTSAQDSQGRPGAPARQGERNFEWHHRPHWVGVPGTRALVVRRKDRPDFDAFRYGHHYYVYEDGNWFRSHDLHGHYSPIEERQLPRDIRRIPQDRWNHYPDHWGDHH